MIVNDFFDKNKHLFYNQPFSNTYKQKIEGLSFVNKYLFFHYCYNNLFYREYNDYSLYCEDKGILTKEEYRKYRDYDDLNSLFYNFIRTYEMIIETGLSVNKFFKIHKDAPLKYRTFYNTQKKFIAHFAKLNVNFANAFYESRKPKSIRCVYDHKHRVQLVKFVDKKIEEQLDNKTNIWLKLARNDVINKEFNFKNISYNTLKKIYREEKGEFVLTKKQFRTEHKFREVVKKPGNVQADIKVLGKHETDVGRLLRLFVVRDIATRVTYTKLLFRETSEEVVGALEEARNYFLKLGIKIISVQTDNAMIFKTTNFVVSQLYFSWCNKNSITPRHIKLKHPESNGIVERFNKMIDDEWHHILINCKTWDEVNEAIIGLTYHYNHNRYMHYGELRNDKYNIQYKDRYLFPINSIKLINNLWKTYEKHELN